MKTLRIIGIILLVPLIATVYLSVLSIKVANFWLIVTAAVIGVILLVGSTNQRGIK